MPSAHVTTGQPIPCTPSGNKVLPVAFRKQIGDNGCWAACMQMAAEFRTHQLHEQCRLAETFVHPRPGPCCSSPLPPACDQPCAHFVIGDAYRGFLTMPAVREQSGYLTPQDLRQQLDADRAVQLKWKPSTREVAHLALVIGYETDPGDPDGIPTRWFVFDPYDGDDWFSYGQLLSRDRGVDPQRPDLWEWVYTWTDL